MSWLSSCAGSGNESLPNGDLSSGVDSLAVAMVSSPGDRSAADAVGGSKGRQSRFTPLPETTRSPWSRCVPARCTIRPYIRRGDGNRTRMASLGADATGYPRPLVTHHYPGPVLGPSWSRGPPEAVMDLRSVVFFGVNARTAFTDGSLMVIMLSTGPKTPSSPCPFILI